MKERGEMEEGRWTLDFINIPSSLFLLPASLIYRIFRDLLCERCGKRKEDSMCDLKAYVKQKDKEDMILEAVNYIRTEGGEVILRNLFGEEKKVRGLVQEVSLIKNRVVIHAD